MSVPIKAFACEFRCGRIATKASTLYEHERRCFRNPDLRACKTCEHNAIDPYESDTGAGGFFYCAIDKRPADKKIITGCEHWQERERVQGGGK